MEDIFLNACGCGGTYNATGSFNTDSGDAPQDLYFEGDVEDGEGEEFDEFLSKKMRERRKVRKALQGEGYSKKEAKQMALEQIPRGKANEVMEQIDALAQKTDQIGGAELDAIIQSASGSGGASGSASGVTPYDSGLGGTKKAGMSMPKWIIPVGVVGAVVVLGVIFRKKLFSKGK